MDQEVEAQCNPAGADGHTPERSHLDQLGLRWTLVYGQDEQGEVSFERPDYRDSGRHEEWARALSEAMATNRSDTVFDPMGRRVVWLDTSGKEVR